MNFPRFLVAEIIAGRKLLDLREGVFGGIFRKDFVNNPLASASVGKLMMKYAIPSVVALVVNSLYNIVDQIFIGWGVGTLGNSATNVVFPPQYGGYGFGLTFGGWRRILFKFGATPDNLPYVYEYGKIVIIGFLFVVIGSGLCSVIRADGTPKLTMVGMIVGCVANVILDALFVLGFGWGMAEAAIATVIGQVLNFAITIWYIPRFKTVKISLSEMKPDFKLLKKTAGYGVSSFVAQIAVAIIMTVINYFFLVFHIFPKQLTAMFGSQGDLYAEFSIRSFEIFTLLCFFNGFQTVADGFAFILALVLTLREWNNDLKVK